MLFCMVQLTHMLNSPCVRCKIMLYFAHVCRVNKTQMHLNLDTHNFSLRTTLTLKFCNNVQLSITKPCCRKPRYQKAKCKVSRRSVIGQKDLKIDSCFNNEHG